MFLPCISIRPLSGDCYGRVCPARPDAPVRTCPRVHAQATASSEPSSSRSEFSSSRRGILLGLPASLLLASGGRPSLALGGGVSMPAAVPRLLEGDELLAVQAALDKFATKQKAPVLLRLIFHGEARSLPRPGVPDPAAPHTRSPRALSSADAGTFDVATGTGGANGSIRLEAELSRPENFGLKRGVSVIRQIQAELEGTPAAGLSFADLICLAAAQAVRVTGGPDIRCVGPALGRCPSSAAAPPLPLPLLCRCPSSAAAPPLPLPWAWLTWLLPTLQGARGEGGCRGARPGGPAADGDRKARRAQVRLWPHGAEHAGAPGALRGAHARQQGLWRPADL